MRSHRSIHSSNFNPNVPTAVIVHGWLSNQNTDINPVIRNAKNKDHQHRRVAIGFVSVEYSTRNLFVSISPDAYLTRKDINIIVLDWKRLARYPYTTAVRGVPDVGRGLGQFIRFLCDTTGAKLSNFHIIGFSLGAHIAGNAGKELGGQVARITALNPAGPLLRLGYPHGWRP
ncbi:hypothetical protein ACJJTC_017221 [Scirpophaga incertulas]